MTLLVPLMMFGWIILSIAMFREKTPQDAVIFVVFGGILFLPAYSYPVSFIQQYDKILAISLSLLVGQMAADRGGLRGARRDPADLPIIVWCLLSPMATSLTNGLGFYDGMTNIVQNSFKWGVFYWIGRKFFVDEASIRKLTMALVVGGLLYIPLIAFEVRMSPQLNSMVYGFFPHSFLQHMRYGGYRPIVFMEHGLMVALWAGVSAVSAYWLWRSRTVARWKGIPMAFIALILAGGTLLCKSSGAIVLTAAGIAVFSFVWKAKSPSILKVLIILAYAYILVRATNILPISSIKAFLSNFFNEERVESAFWRLREEDLFGDRTRLRPIFGWGQFNRGWPIDPRTGNKLIEFIDSLWLIVYNTYGLAGLLSAFLVISVGPLKIIRAYSKRRPDDSDRGNEAFACSMCIALVVILFLYDCLMNAMFNPVYLVCTGALVSHAKMLEDRSSLESAPAIEDRDGGDGASARPEAEAAKA